MFLKVYGCRGSSPVSRINKPAGNSGRSTGGNVYGGNTSCFKLESSGRSLILDAGSGLLAPENLPEPLNILLSHLHMDHIIGLATCPQIWARESGVRIFTRDRRHGNIKSQVLGVFTPPYWPLPLDKVSGAEIVAVTDGVSFSPDEVFSVTPFSANHPDGTFSYKITDGKKTLVYMLDYEIDTLPESAYKLLAGQCAGADVIVCDTTYHPDDYPEKRGWGHSTVTDAVRLANDSGCKKMLFSHFSFDYANETLDKWHELLNSVEGKERFLFARDGMEIEI